MNRFMTAVMTNIESKSIESIVDIAEGDDPPTTYPLYGEDINLAVAGLSITIGSMAIVSTST